MRDDEQSRDMMGHGVAIEKAFGQCASGLQESSQQISMREKELQERLGSEKIKGCSSGNHMDDWSHDALVLVRTLKGVVLAVSFIFDDTSSIALGIHRREQEYLNGGQTHLRA